MYAMYYASMLRCWQLVRILVRTNYHCLSPGCHSQCDWRTCHSRRGILDTSRRFQRKILGCSGLLIPTDSSQRSFSRFYNLFLEHGDDGPHTLLNGVSEEPPLL
jgi:hypothetical protein